MGANQGAKHIAGGEEGHADGKQAQSIQREIIHGVEHHYEQGQVKIQHLPDIDPDNSHSNSHSVRPAPSIMESMCSSTPSSRSGTPTPEDRPIQNSASVTPPLRATPGSTTQGRVITLYRVYGGIGTCGGIFLYRAAATSVFTYHARNGVEASLVIEKVYDSNLYSYVQTYLSI